MTPDPKHLKWHEDVGVFTYDGPCDPPTAEEQAAYDASLEDR